MIVRKASFNLFVGALAISVLGMSGCRTAGFGKPDLSKLAFWKRGGVAAKDTLPPPARHFDPAPLEGQIAKQTFDSDETISLNSKRFTDSLNQKTNSARDQIAGAAKSLNQPIRKPYSTNLDSDVADLGQNFSEKASGKMADFGGGLTNSQQDFKAAMAGTKNTFKADLPKTTMSNGWKDDFKFPESPLSKSTGGNSFANTKPVYDANGKLVASAQDAKNSVTEKLNQLNNSFKSNTSSVADTKNQFAANASTNFDSVKSKTAAFTAPNQFTKPKQFDTTPFKAPAQIEPSSQFKAPSGGFGGTNGFQSPSNQVASNELNRATTILPPDAVSKKENLQLELVQSQVREAKLQIEALKSQLAAAGQNRNAVNRAPQNSFPPERVAQLQTPRFSNTNSSQPNSSPSTGYATNSSSAPANILRNQQSAPNGFTPQTNQQQDFTPQNAPAPPSYPATPHGGFSNQNQFGQSPSPQPKGNFAPVGVQAQQTVAAPKPPQPASFASFESPSGGFGSGISTPGYSKPTGGVSKIKSHIADVEIPASVLTGSGSYAPGTVHAVSK